MWVVVVKAWSTGTIEKSRINKAAVYQSVRRLDMPHGLKWTNPDQILVVERHSIVALQTWDARSWKFIVDDTAVFSLVGLWPPYEDCGRAAGFHNSQVG
jgi:hypothetical protein